MDPKRLWTQVPLTRTTNSRVCLKTAHPSFNGYVCLSQLTKPTFWTHLHAAVYLPLHPWVVFILLLPPLVRWSTPKNLCLVKFLNPLWCSLPKNCIKISHYHSITIIVDTLLVIQLSPHNRWSPVNKYAIISYHHSMFFYAQTPQFAHTTVKEILKGVLKFKSQREHSAWFNRGSRES